MDFTVNKIILELLLDDEKENKDITSFLNEIIDSELEKNSPDCDLIDECISIIDKIQSQNNIYPLLSLVLTKKQVLKYCKKSVYGYKTVKAIAAACLVMLISTGTVFYAQPALAENVKSFFETVISTLQDMSEKSVSDEESEIISIYVVFQENGRKTVASPEDIDISKITVTAVYNDSTEKNIDISQCTVQTKQEKILSKNYIVVYISYDGCACSMAFEIKE